VDLSGIRWTLFFGSRRFDLHAAMRSGILGTEAVPGLKELRANGSIRICPTRRTS
jgi:hypothetical protein